MLLQTHPEGCAGWVIFRIWLHFLFLQTCFSEVWSTGCGRVVHAVLFGMIKCKGRTIQQMIIKELPFFPKSWKWKNQPKWKEIDIGGTHSPLPWIWEEGHIKIHYTLRKHNQQYFRIFRFQHQTNKNAASARAKSASSARFFASKYSDLSAFVQRIHGGNIWRSMNHTPQKIWCSWQR